MVLQIDIVLLYEISNDLLLVCYLITLLVWGLCKCLQESVA